MDADESPYDAAVRELKEELGILVAPGRLLVVDWVPPRPGRTEGVMFVFDGGVLDPARGSEIHLPAEELRAGRGVRRTRRIPGCRSCWPGGYVRLGERVTMYLENGNQVV